MKAKEGHVERHGLVVSVCVLCFEGQELELSFFFCWFCIVFGGFSPGFYSLQISYFHGLVPVHHTCNHSESKTIKSEIKIFSYIHDFAFDYRNSMASSLSLFHFYTINSPLYCTDTYRSISASSTDS